jgi:HK97 family phage prohead protease
VTIATRRSPICLRGAEFRSASADPGDGRTLEGYGAVFNTPTRIQSWDGEWDEQIAPGAFKRTLRSSTPVLQFDHGRDQRTGSVPIGAIDELREDDEGLFVSARLFDNPVVDPIRQAIAGGAISGMSFRFQVAAEQWTDNAGKVVKDDDELARLLWEPGDRGPLQRTIQRVDPLYELGPVVFPAYEATSVGVRSLLEQLTPDEHRSMIRELAADLRRAQSAGIPDLAAGSDARGAGGSEPGTEPSSGRGPALSARQRLDTEALRMRRITR